MVTLKHWCCRWQQARGSKTTRPLACVLLLTTMSAVAGPQPDLRQSITHNEITWTFAEPTKCGAFITGDPWVIGPVSVVGITNSLNSPDFTPEPGENGSEVNPTGSVGQGYDSGAKSYRAELNAALPHERPLSPENPERNAVACSSHVLEHEWSQDVQRAVPRGRAG